MTGSNTSLSVCTYIATYIATDLYIAGARGSQNGDVSDRAGSYIKLKLSMSRLRIYKSAECSKKMFELWPKNICSV